MSIQTEITRIQTARDTIRTKAVQLGIGGNTDKLDTLATEINGIANNGAVEAEVKEGESYTIPKGYHNGAGTVTGVAGGGNYSLQKKEVTPTKSQQSISPDEGYYGLSSVVVGAIPDAYQDTSSVTATAADVLANKIIVNAEGELITGTMPNNGAINAEIDGLTTTSYQVAAGYTTGGTVTLDGSIEAALAAI